MDGRIDRGEQVSQSLSAAPPQHAVTNVPAHGLDALRPRPLRDVAAVHHELLGQQPVLALGHATHALDERVRDGAALLGREGRLRERLGHRLPPQQLRRHTHAQRRIPDLRVRLAYLLVQSWCMVVVCVRPPHDKQKTVDGRDDVFGFLSSVGRSVGRSSWVE